MNTSNPFDTQGKAQAQINQSRTRLRFAVFTAFGVSLLVLVPLLVQTGCKRQEEAQPVAETNAVPFIEDTNALPADLTHTNLVLPPLTPVGSNVMTPVTPLPMEGTAVAVPAATSGTEYTVVKGDSFYTIGKKFGVSVKQMQEANPGVDSSKLKIGQKLNVPAAAPHEAGAAVSGAVETVASGSRTYTVKSGDTLMKIAKQNGTTYKAIKAANGLSTDKIRVGQKLKIPVKEAAPAIAPVVEPAPAPAPVPVLPLPPTAAPAATPVR